MSERWNIMTKLTVNELNTSYLQPSRTEFWYLIRYLGQTENSVSILLGRNRHYIAQQTKISPALVEEYRILIGNTLFFYGHAAVLRRRKKEEQLRQQRIKEEAEAFRIKDEKAAERRASRNSPAL